MIAIAYYSKETTTGYGIVKFTNQNAQFFYFNQTSCQEQEEQEEQRTTFT